jgi:hypothetical protein
MTPKTELQPVILVWADAHADSEGWTARGEWEIDGELLVETCGWLLPVDEGGKEGHVTIIQSITPHDDIDHVIHVPVSMSRSLTFLRPFTKDLHISS